MTLSDTKRSYRVPRDTFFFDNCLSPVLVEGLRAFGEDVQHLRDTFPSETPDSIWIPEVAKRKWILITRDKRIRTRPLESEALVKSGLCTFVFVQKRDPDRWGWVELVVRRWMDISAFADKEKRPFLAAIPERGGIERLR